MHSYDEPVYLISVVASILDIHPQTLRQYEKEGLIEPSRTQGRMRLYSQRDIDKIKLVLQLTRKMGINLAGVDVILKLKKQIDLMTQEIDSLREELSKVNRNGSVPTHKSVVTTSNYDIIIFEDNHGVVDNKKSRSGYGVFVPIKQKEYNQTKVCKSKGAFQYDYTKYLTLGRINDNLKFSKNSTRQLIIALLKNKNLGKLFIEPNLKTRLNLTDNRIRNHGCRAVRHDDHIHIQLR